MFGWKRGFDQLSLCIILGVRDQVEVLPLLHVPPPKDESATYAVPDVSQWKTWLNPPPAHPSVAHPDRDA